MQQQTFIITPSRKIAQRIELFQLVGVPFNQLGAGK